MNNRQYLWSVIFKGDKIFGRIIYVQITSMATEVTLPSCG